ncbi:MAG: hypothetical protein AB7S54_06600 [Bacteroidales bacterium]
MKKIALLFITIILALTTSAQSISNIKFRQEGNKIIVTYRIDNIRYDLKYATSIYVSTDAGRTFRGPLKAVSGDVGEISPEETKTITWNVFEEYESLSGDIVFDIRLSTERIPLPRKTFIIYSMSSIAPFGVMVGNMRRFGWYLSVRTNGTFSVAGDYNTYNDDLTNYTGDGYYKFTDQVKRVRYSLHSGGTVRLNNSLFLYAGAGYGSRHLYWQVTEYSYVNDSELGKHYADHVDFSHDGLEIETGVQFMLKKFTIGVGFNSMNFKNNEVIGSIGVVL